LLPDLTIVVFQELKVSFVIANIRKPGAGGSNIFAGTANPYAFAPVNGTICCCITHANHLFLWIGNNDVLGYATTVGWNNQLRPAGAAGVG
jgi:hypothetical protein